jgi:hypothetical protein
MKVSFLNIFKKNKFLKLAILIKPQTHLIKTLLKLPRQKILKS